MSSRQSPPNLTLVDSTRIARTRALAWSGDDLYASRGYELFRAKIHDLQNLAWQSVAEFRPGWLRRLSVTNCLSARLSRAGFHALAVLPSGGIVGAVPGAIVTIRPGEKRFRVTHMITRGARPLHICAVPGGAIYWGEYFDNAARDEVHIYASTDDGAIWNVAYTFPKGAVRHVHNIVYDRWGNCLWILTGDYGDECRVLRAACDLSTVDVVLQGKQQARAVASVPAEDALYFSSDTPLESNHIYRLDRRGELTQLAGISSSSIYGCRVGSQIFFSTMVEPSRTNPDPNVRIYAGDTSNPQNWSSPLSWRKDRWPMRLFQYGNAFLPDGENSTRFLAVSTIAVESDDMATTIYSTAP